MQQKEGIDSLLKTCQAAKDSVDAFLRSINDHIEIVEGFPPVARPLIRRDLESNTGMTQEEWKTFLGRLHTRYSSIYDAAERVTIALANNYDEADIARYVTSLKEVAAPLIEGADIAVDELETMAVYLEGLTDKINMVPDAFLNAEARDELISSLPARAERARAVKEIIVEMKRELIAITG